MDKVKILVLNPSNKVDEIVTKSNLQHAKNGPFGSIILLNKLVTTDKKFHQSTYFYDDKPGEIDDNLNSVRGLVKLASGINIVFCGNEEIDIDGKETIDILVTHALPVTLDDQGQLNIDKMIKKFKPRYVFSTGTFKEFEPFEWENGTITRIISLSQEGEGKWFYAFNISKLAGEIDRRSLVPNPFITKRTRENPDESNEPTKKKLKVVTPDECFFCLSNPNVETHMIVEIEKLVYLTIAKGPLTRYNKDIPFAGHGIIIPIEHKPMIDLTDDSYKEIESYELKLFKKFNEKFNGEFVPIFFDINLKTNVHYHKQFLPINKKYLVDNNFESSLEERSKINNEKYVKNHKLKFNKMENMNDLHGKQFISFKVYDSEIPTIYACIIEESKSIDLQFPRRVLTHILNTPKRLYWDKCKQGKHQEMRECEEFKKFLM